VTSALAQSGDPAGSTAAVEDRMKSIASLTAAAAAMAGGILYMASASGQTDGDASPIYGVKIPAGFRDWRLISIKIAPQPRRYSQTKSMFVQFVRSIKNSPLSL
jgi:hypothetical protein